MMEKEKRIGATLVVAGLLKNQRGEALLVERNGEWTLPTGHMNILVDTNLRETLQREMKEELQGLKDLTIIEALDTFVRYSATARYKAKSIAIYSCNVNESEIQYFNEGGEKRKFIWIRPSQALNLPIDDLAKLGFKRFMRRYQRNGKS